MQIREVMTPNPACCTPDSALRDVAVMMEQNDCGLIPVVDSFANMIPVGTITDRDIAIRAVAANQNPMDMKASDIMTADIATVTPQTGIEECFRVMEDREIRRVVVTDEQGKCCGIVAQADIVQTDLNPARTNKVIREISESAPSRNPGLRIGGSWRRSNGRSSSGESVMSSGPLVPLLAGLGTGVALMYLLNSRRSSPSHVYMDDGGTAYDSDSLSAADPPNVGRYVDAEEEIEKRQHHLQERIQTVKTGSSQATGTDGDADDRGNDLMSDQRGRSAGQGS